MGAKFSFPSKGTTTFANPIALEDEFVLNPSHFSTLGAGGLHEVVDIDERNDIITTETGKQTEGNIYSSGRRHVGMLVHVYGMEDPTIYKLIPQGYWENLGSKGYTDWVALEEEQRTSLLNPYEVFKVKDGRKYNVFKNGVKHASNVSNSVANAKKAELIAARTPADHNVCWVKLELGGDTTPYVNGVQNKPGAWASVNQTGEGSDAPAVYGNKKFINSELHLKYSPSDTIGGIDQISDSEDDAALKVDKKVTIGTASEEIFSVKENIINLHTITNAKNIPNVTATDRSGWGHDVPVEGDAIVIGSYNHTFKVGDLYTFQNPEGYTILGVVAT
tara:strand:- start:509 stop:1507 length:999 start_codon:yes stop_codon:yes gene_type:complete